MDGEQAVTGEAEAGPEDLGHPNGYAEGHAEEGIATDGFESHNPAALQGPEVQWDGEGEQVKPQGEEPDGGKVKGSVPEFHK
jgi:hypothetical protein